jgi:large subunit ribosomal protein L13
MTDTIVVDATGHIAGRLASIVAKKLLEGYNVVIVNAEKAVISGKRKTVIEDFKGRFQISSIINPRRHGPFWPHTPQGILRRMIRGMVPRRKGRGYAAMRRLKVFPSIPDEYKSAPLVRFPEASASRLSSGYVTLEEIARELGWRRVDES